ncbi:hypothetical protein CHCC20333_4393 [Bacillus paralicheniformis]|nr:hypothetical protein CHCC20333_4393 [Bacillus paralicheniformis]
MGIGLKKDKSDQVPNHLSFGNSPSELLEGCCFKNKKAGK